MREILYKKIKGIQCRRCRRYTVQISMRSMVCMSETSKMVFAAFTQHCMQSTDSCRRCRRYSVYSGPSPRQEGRLVVAVCPVGLAVHHHAVRGGSFVNFLGLVTLQGWLQARRTANPQFLKLKGAQQPGNSYISMGTKLHPPHSNRTCHKQII